MLSKRLETPGSIALLAGFLCYAAAFSVLILAPEILTDQSVPRVVGTDGVPRDVRPYAPVEARGREVYGKQVCWHCHSQFVRPVNEEDKRWGPVSQSGEYAFDVPHLFGTRRTGPDLHREGGLRIDDWHLAHFFNPRFTVPLSVMPAFTWLFRDAPNREGVREALALLDTNGDGIVSTKIGDEAGEPPAALKEAVERARRSLSNQDPLTKIDRRGIRGPGRSVDSLWWNEEPESGEGLLTDYDAAPRPTEDALALTAYLQRLGTGIGKWRRPLHAPTPTRANPFDEVEPRPRRPAEARVFGFLLHDAARVKQAEEARRGWEAATAAWDARHPVLAGRLHKGKEVFDRHCQGCHGPEGRGNGPAAQFMLIRPRDFTTGKFKFRSTPVGAMPLDGDLYRSIFRGLPGSTMPAWAKDLSDEQIWLLVDYVKSLFEGDKPFNDLTAVVPVSPPPRFDPFPAKELARGRAVYLAGQCYNCHGKEGRADGPGWNDAATDWGAALRPRDLRPRISPKDAKDLHDLMGRHLERFFGAEAWRTLADTAAWKDLAPTDPGREEAFVLLLLGRGPRLKDVFGEEAVRKAMGEAAYAREFEKGDDPLEDLRMAVATEKDDPSLRFRGGAYAEDLYRTLMTGIEGTQMKQMYDFFWKKTDATLEGRDDVNKDRRARRFVWVPVSGEEKKLSIVTNDPALRAVGVYVRKNEKGEDEEFLKVQPGDDWALVRYVQWISCSPRIRVGN